jgi:hypothetical protein
MAQCANCKFDFAQHDEHNPPGQCDSCFSDVCFSCGCTEWQPCRRPNNERDLGRGYYTCSWQQLTIDDPDSAGFGLAALVTPGICSFCFQQMAAESYAVVNFIKGHVVQT